MLRDFITYKWVMGAIAFLIVLSVACIWWYRYDTAPYKREAAETEQLLRQSEIEKSDIGSATTDSLHEAGRKLAEGRNVTVYNLDEPPPKKTRTNKNLQTESVETVKQDKITQSDVQISPHGFGPYPEIPADFPYPVEWTFPNSNANHELMARVAIKLWKQGIKTYGVTMEDGKVYPNYIDTVYVRWRETTDDDGNPIQYIGELGGYPPACLRIVDNNIVRNGERDIMTEADIPSDVTVKLYDESGIDPYTFLDLPK